jgi:transposase-like protein
MSVDKPEFTAKFKRDIVREYRKGGISLADLAAKHEGLTVAKIVNWKAKKPRKPSKRETTADPKPAKAKQDKPLFVLTGHTIGDLRDQLTRLEALRG